MKTIAVFCGFLALACALPPRPVGPQGDLAENLKREEEEQQNTNAQYQFSSSVEDHINDQTQQRTEVREGKLVKGSYAYSDGYVRRVVQYEADENGYRVIGEEIQPLEGPKIDLAGSASIQQSAHGTNLKYSVQSIPEDGPTSKVVERFTE